MREDKKNSSDRRRKREKTERDGRDEMRELKLTHTGLQVVTLISHL